MNPRTGIGTDVHAYGEPSDGDLSLAGLTWPGELPLSGHSDGDVAAHAACDALPVVGLAVRRCSSITVTVPMGSALIPDGDLFGQPHIRVENPAPAGCGHDSDGVLTTLPAPMVALSPMVIPGNRIAPPPIQTCLPIVTGKPTSSPCARSAGSLACWAQ